MYFYDVFFTILIFLGEDRLYLNTSENSESVSPPSPEEILLAEVKRSFSNKSLSEEYLLCLSFTIAYGFYLRFNELFIC